MRRRIAVLLAVAVMAAMTVASTGVAAAAPANGKGAEKASPNAAFGISLALQNITKHNGGGDGDDGGCGAQCEPL